MGHVNQWDTSMQGLSDGIPSLLPYYDRPSEDEQRDSTASSTGWTYGSNLVLEGNPNCISGQWPSIVGLSSYIHEGITSPTQRYSLPTRRITPASESGSSPTRPRRFTTSLSTHILSAIAGYVFGAQLTLSIALGSVGLNALVLSTVPLLVLISIALVLMSWLSARQSPAG